MIVSPASEFGGAIQVPGDKSVTHRAFMLAALCNGVTEISGGGDGADNLSTLSALEALGVQVERPDAEHVIIHGVGRRGLSEPDGPIDCGNSGTTARLLTGVLAGAGVKAVLVGDESLSRRPMRRVADPLIDLGYEVETAEDGTLPLRLSGAPRKADSTPVRALLKTASAQVKSCILLSGLFRSTLTEVVEPAVSRDHTERLLRALGVRCVSTPHYLNPSVHRDASDAPLVRLHPAGSLRADTIDVPGDASSAAFVLAAGALTGDGVTVEGMGINPTRCAWLDVMEAMGVDISITGRSITHGGEPVASVSARRGPLKATTIEGRMIPALIDEIPILCILGAASEGRFVVRDAAELRVKETDRIETTARLLRSMGVDVETTPDGLAFDGLGRTGWSAFECDAAGDHRIAMAAAVAALAADGPCKLLDPECIAVSWPGFADALRELGAAVDDSDSSHPTQSDS